MSEVTKAVLISVSRFRDAVPSPRILFNSKVPGGENSPLPSPIFAPALYCMMYSDMQRCLSKGIETFLLKKRTETYPCFQKISFVRVVEHHWLEIGLWNDVFDCFDSFKVRGRQLSFHVATKLQKNNRDTNEPRTKYDSSRSVFRWFRES